MNLIATKANASYGLEARIWENIRPDNSTLYIVTYRDVDSGETLPTAHLCYSLSKAFQCANSFVNSEVQP